MGGGKAGWQGDSSQQCSKNQKVRRVRSFQRGKEEGKVKRLSRCPARLTGRGEKVWRRGVGEREREKKHRGQKP